ncbi:hypothetical protein TNCV_3282701 [Trichonephila clavipes]|nr:hypothetical protein TNCV_3282701 [Trichonephila clavipes]
MDAAVVQKNSLRVDELLSKLVSLEEQLTSLKLQRKVRSSSPHHHQRSRSRSKSRRRYNPQGRYCLPFPIREEVPPAEVATIQENNDLSTVNRASKYFNLLKLYPDLTKPNLVNRVVKHEVKHHILTTGQPVI